MENLVLTDVKSKLANARNLCKGMSEEIYALTDYMSKVANDTLVPSGLVVCLVCVMDDIKKETCGFAANVQFPEYFVTHKEQVLNQIAYIPQVIDEIASEDFSMEFRALCKNFLKINPPRRVDVELETECPDYVKAAVNWWAKAILSPKLDNGEALPTFLAMMAANSTKTYSKQEILIFKETLAQAIINEINKHGLCILSVDYSPCLSLANAGEKIGINSMMGYPWKTRMEISKTLVKVSSGYSAPYTILWQKD